ncbi:MAG: leucine--tRNA ligase, partial [Flavobacteriales bacterium]|nr:leucine--tRNA ligase [Flavobacteriales bacterium]
RWTQWVFLQLFDSWYNIEAKRAEPIASLIRRFEHNGFTGIDRRRLTGDEDMEAPTFTAEEWKAFNPREQEAVLQFFRLAYRSEAWVNWCPALGTVLANDEVKDGVSERGGHPVERKRMPHWSIRITAYAQRLLDSLDELDWSESIKEAQRNWIGRSRGALVKFPVVGHEEVIEVFTTRPDTLFGVTFVTLAPEHQLLDKLVTPERRAEVMAYCEQAKNRSERDRMADVKTVSGAFTGAYVKHPFTGADVPIWVGDYVLLGYATGAVMAVPGGDQRDWNFARHFNLPIIAVTEGADIAKEADERKDATLINSGFLNGLEVPNAITRAIQELETLGVGEGRINYRLRDAAFGRQRYWGEPIPIYYEDGLPKAVKDEHLPLVLPEVDKFLPTADGEPPLARAADWSYSPLHGRGAGGEGYSPLETTTMPGWAGSSWYWLRYMDPGNTERFAGKEAVDYWKQVDLYVGGSEHATGHLLYVRFWTKFLFDRGFIAVEEPAQKLVNQGMIQGVSAILPFVSNAAISLSSEDLHLGLNRQETPLLYVSQSIVDKGVARATELVTARYLEYWPWLAELSSESNFSFTLSDAHVDIELVAANNSLRHQEFKLRKEQSFSKDREVDFLLDEEGRILTRREVEKMSKRWFNVVNPDDIIEKYGADTLRLYEMFLGPLEQSKPWDTNGIEGTSRFLKKFWNLFFESDILSVSDVAATKAELKVLHATLKKVTEDIEKLSFNGKTRLQLEFPMELDAKSVEAAVLANPEVQARLEGKLPKKVIVVPKRIVNIVI